MFSPTASSILPQPGWKQYEPYRPQPYCYDNRPSMPNFPPAYGNYFQPSVVSCNDGSREPYDARLQPQPQYFNGRSRGLIPPFDFTAGPTIGYPNKNESACGSIHHPDDSPRNFEGWNHPIGQQRMAEEIFVQQRHPTHRGIHALDAQRCFETNYFNPEIDIADFEDEAFHAPLY